MTRIKVIAGAMLCVGMVLIVSAVLTRDNADSSSSHSNIRFINATDILAGRSGGSTQARKALIEAIAHQQHRSIESVELDIANAIIESRKEARSIFGNFDPGIHIVRGTSESRIDGNVVKIVPDGSLLDMGTIAKKGVLRSPQTFHDDKSLYIRPASLTETSLSGAKMAGYQVSGGYLNGNDYARTDLLRNLEATPSGRNGWTGITRLYTGHPTLNNFIFEENDLTAGQQIVLIPDNTLNSYVGSYRATLGRFQSSNGSTMSDLNWITPEGRSFSLKIRQVDDASVNQLMRLAESIAKQGK